jgi:hypothetical protein
MFTSNRAARAAVIGAAALMLSFTAPLSAQTHAHDAAAPARLALDHGRKWPTDAALRAGMENIRKRVVPQLARGEANDAEQAKLAAQIERELGTIVAQCKLAPEADAMLHLVIADIGTGVDAMRGKDPAHTPAEGLRHVAHALDQYARHFDHPGFKPIHR